MSLFPTEMSPQTGLFKYVKLFGFVIQLSTQKLQSDHY